MSNSSNANGLPSMPDAAQFDIPVNPTIDLKKGGTLLSVPYIDQRPARNLCWAACCEMVLEANGNDSTKICDIVGYTCNTQCCTGAQKNPVLPVCDVTADVLTAYKSLQSNLPIGWNCEIPKGRALEWNELTTVVNEGRRPVEAKFDWTNFEGTDTQGHVVMLIGTRLNGNDQYVFVNDSWYGWGWVKYDSVCSAYGQGCWADSYPGVGGPLVPL